MSIYVFKQKPKHVINMQRSLGPVEEEDESSGIVHMPTQDNDVFQIGKKFVSHFKRNFISQNRYLPARMTWLFRCNSLIGLSSVVLTEDRKLKLKIKLMSSLVLYGSECIILLGENY